MRAPSAFLPNMRQYHRGRGESRMVWGQRASLSVAGSVLLMGCLLSSVAAGPDGNPPPQTLPVPGVGGGGVPPAVRGHAHRPGPPGPSPNPPFAPGAGLLLFTRVHPAAQP